MLDFLLLYGLDNIPIPDAVVDVFSDRKLIGAMFPYKEAVYRLSPRRDRMAVFCSAPELAQHLSRSHDGKSIFFFDGTLVQDDIVCDVRRLAPLLPENETDFINVYGNFMQGCFSDAGDDWLVRDVLGYYPLFVGMGDGFLAISNNPHFTAQALYPGDYAWRKHARSLAWLCINTAIQDPGTGYVDVWRVPVNAGLRIGRNNLARYFVLSGSLHEKTDRTAWQAGLERGIEQARAYYEYAGRAGRTIQGDITGGYDSRVSIALAVNCGIQNQVDWNVCGNEGQEAHPDVICAREIAHSLGVKVNFTLFNQSVVNYTRESYQTKIAASHHATAGIYPLLSLVSIPAVPRLEPIFRVSGNAGEMFRGYRAWYYAYCRGISNSPCSAEAFARIRSGLYQDGIHYPMMRPEYQAYLHNSVTRQAGTVDNLYDFLDVIHCVGHLCLHGGGNYKRISSGSPPNLSPAHNARLHNAAYTCPPELRMAPFIHFSIIEKTCPELLFIPFGEERLLEPILWRHRPDAKRFSTIKPIRNTSQQPLAVMANTLTLLRLIEKEHFLEFHDALLDVFDADRLRTYMHEIMELLENHTGTVTPGVAWRGYCAMNLVGINMFLKAGTASGAPRPSVAASAYRAEAFSPGSFSPPRMEDGRRTMSVADAVRDGTLILRTNPTYGRHSYWELTSQERRVFEKELQRKQALQ